MAGVTMVPPQHWCNSLPLEVLYGALCDTSVSGTLVVLTLKGSRLSPKGISFSSFFIPHFFFESKECGKRKRRKTRNGRSRLTEM